VACTSRLALTDHAVTKWNTAEERTKKKEKITKHLAVNLLYPNTWTENVHVLRMRRTSGAVPCC